MDPPHRVLVQFYSRNYVNLAIIR